MNRERPQSKYPHSASLFQFCKRVLGSRFGGMRVIDQDVGQILGFDPADCSHWKKGKKNIRSVEAIQKIASNLDIDQELIINIATGVIDDSEGFFEYLGYGPFSIEAKFVEEAKKRYFRSQQGKWNADSLRNSDNTQSLDIGKINKHVDRIIDRLNLKNPPLYVPELNQLTDIVRLKPVTDSIIHSVSGDIPLIRHIVEDNKLLLQYKPELENKPFYRFAICKALGAFLLGHDNFDGQNTDPIAAHIQDAENNLFALKLLMPEDMVRTALKEVNLSKDIVNQLSEIFWVSKSLVNYRLQSLLV